MKPILFSAPMVRAILDGRKTMTRRIVKPAGLARMGPDGPEFWTGFMGWQLAGAVLADQSFSTNKQTRCPYGQPGDRLWVRETWAQNGPDWCYRADCEDRPRGAGAWRRSIHMPRSASRITLEITDVRVERLQDISEADAEAEGAEPLLVPPDGGSCPYTAGFRALWEQINGAGSWDANPWVWCVSFRRAQA